MNEARFPYDYIPDSAKGRPLFNASLYYGVPDLDPEIPANQVSVSLRQEDGSIVSVSQPVNTGAGGVPMYNGSPVTVLIDEDIFSFKALDKNGSQIYYEARAESALGSGATVGHKDTYADVRAITDTGFDYLIVGGANTLGDGGGGAFAKVASGADNGITILVDASGGVWERIYSGKVSARWGGAIGDGVTDDLAAWENLLAYFPTNVEGADGDTYLLSGDLVLPAVCKIENAAFKCGYTSPTARPLYSPANTMITLINVDVNLGDDTENGQLNNSGGVWIVGGIIVYHGGDITGNGYGGGVSIQSFYYADVSGVRVHDISFGTASTPAITDDVFQGIWLNQGEKAVIEKCHVENIYGQWLSQTPVTRFSRGFAVGGTKDFSFSDCHADTVDQGYDFSGDQNTSRFSVVGCHALNCYTWGFKAANTVTDGSYTNCRTYRCDLGGFVASAPNVTLPNPASERTQKLRYVACAAVETGYVGNWTGLANVAGFKTSSSGIYPDYSRGVKWIGCEAISKGYSQWGFFNEVAVPGNATLWNECISCESTGATSADFQGINVGYIERSLNVDQSIPNAAVTPLVWVNTVFDGFNGASSTTDVTIRRDGLWNINANVLFTGNATGVRLCAIYVNGAEVTAAAFPANASSTSAAVSATLFLEAGDIVDIRVRQDSGIALDALAINDRTKLTITEVKQIGYMT